MKSLSIKLLASSMLLLLGACSSSSYNPGPKNQNLAAARSESPSTGSLQATLYVLNLGGGEATVTTYPQGKTKPAHTIDLGPAPGNPQYYHFMSVSSSGLLYTEAPRFPSESHSQGKLSIFADQGEKRVAATNIGKNYHLMTTDEAGNVYTMCRTSLLCEFTPAGKVVRKISMGQFGRPDWRSIQALATDSAGDVAVLDDQGALVFPPGSQKPTWTVDDNSGLSQNTAATFDASGDLYIAGSNDEVQVYPPNAESPSLVIDIYAPKQIFCDAHGTLYVLNGLSVTEFGRGQSIPKKTITKGISYATSMALDADGNLYVANKGTSQQASNVTIYAASSGKLLETLTDGVSSPFSVGVSS